MKDVRSFVAGFTIAFVTSFTALYTYSYFFPVRDEREKSKKDDNTYKEKEESFRDEEEKLVFEALLAFWENNFVKKLKKKDKKLETLTKKIKEPLSTSLGESLLANIALTKLREYKKDDGMSDSWHIIDDEEEQDEEKREDHLTSDLKKGVRSVIGFAVSQLLGDVSFVRLAERIFKNTLIRLICADENQRQTALECVRDACDSFQDKISISDHLMDCIHHAADSKSPGKGFALTIRGCVIATPDSEIEEVNINQILILSNGTYRNATTTDLVVGKNVRHFVRNSQRTRNNEHTHTQVRIRDSFLVAGSSEEDHKEQFEIDAIVMEAPKETSSWLWGSKTTCRVRYDVVSEKPQVVSGADPSSDRARFTILACIPLGPLGNKKTRIQLYVLSSYSCVHYSVEGMYEETTTIKQVRDRCACLCGTLFKGLTRV